MNTMVIIGGFLNAMNGIRLSDLSTGECGYIVRIKGRGAFRHRIMEMGFVKGRKVKVIKNAPLKDPIEFSLMGYNVSLRRHEASIIEVMQLRAEAGRGWRNHTDELQYRTNLGTENRDGNTIRVAMVGNPNAGKTSIFNWASDSRERVGNYGGVTVDSKTAVVKIDQYTIQLTDLPGTYSLACYSPEELYVRDYLLEGRPDVVINIVDSSNLERNLYLTSQLIEMNLRVVVALNMYDELRKSGDEIDYQSLGRMLGIPFIPTVGSKGKGIPELLGKVVEVYAGREQTSRNVIIPYDPEIEASLTRIQKTIGNLSDRPEKNIPSRLLAIKLLENDLHIRNFIINNPSYKQILTIIREEQERIEFINHEPAETFLTDARYGFIAGALKETFKPEPVTKRKTTEIIDAFLTHRLIGFPVFVFFLWLMFTCTFSLGRYPVDWIENGVLALSNLIGTSMGEGSLKALLIDGIIGGVGGVIVFLPNILILFLFISVMEDTGYMARAAFIMDRLMHAIGLHGKSFIPMIMAFGCNVPAIMSTRTIESRNDRILTMIINPFMSCSARLPVYILLIGAIFPSHSGAILFTLYFTGILVAVITALVFKKLFFRKESLPFVMELPPYRMPTMRSTLKHMWDKASQYLRKMGGLIMAASILIWALGYFPRKTNPNYAPLIAEQVKQSETIRRSEQQEKSYIGRIGKGIEPLIKPLGFDWKMGVSLISGIAAKEIVVSTMGVIYHTDDTERPAESLTESIRSAVYSDGIHKGKPVFTPLSSFSFLLFTLLYFPCIATIAAIRRESGSMKWALFTVFYTTALAWLVSFLFYQIGSLLIN